MGISQGFPLKDYGEPAWSRTIFILDQNDDETNSIVFYSAVSFPFPWELPMGMLYSRRMIRIRRRCVSVQIRICTGIKKQ